VDLLSASVLVGAIILTLLGRWLLHRWQDKHWDERHKAADAAQDQVISQIRDDRGVGQVLRQYPNVGSEWSEGQRGGPSDLAP
jgi:hypothetical protein